MIQELYFYHAPAFQPRRNQALEAYFTERVKAGQLVFYLWQNEKTVFIGRNQSAFAECDVKALEADGGFLARRLSGGGAVYHDKENLNFTFALQKADYDSRKQTEVILEAVRSLGLDARRSGRNDLTIDGRKFSGHSYYKRKEQCFHNGTLLLDTDLGAMQRYLKVPAEKLKSHKVRSVPSRVVNLRELLPGLQISQLVTALREAAEKVYGLPARTITEDALDEDGIKTYFERFSSPDWLYGEETGGAYSLGRRFPWGQFHLRFDIEDGRLSGVKIFSDGLEAAWLRRLAASWEGLPAERSALIRALEAVAEESESESDLKAIKDDIKTFVKEQKPFN